MEDSCRIDSHGTRDGDTSTSPGGGAAGVPLRTPFLQAVLQIAAAFGPPTPHILRRSCAVSLQKTSLKTAPTCFEPDVNNQNVARSDAHGFGPCTSQTLFGAGRERAQRIFADAIRAFFPSDATLDEAAYRLITTP